MYTVHHPHPAEHTTNSNIFCHCSLHWITIYSGHITVAMSISSTVADRIVTSASLLWFPFENNRTVVTPHIIACSGPINRNKKSDTVFKNPMCFEEIDFVVDFLCQTNYYRFHLNVRKQNLTPPWRMCLSLSSRQCPIDFSYLHTSSSQRVKPQRREKSGENTRYWWIYMYI